MQNRREFIKFASASAAAVLSLKADMAFSNETNRPTIKPPKLNQRDTVGLITPASPLFEAHQVIIEAVGKLENCRGIVFDRMNSVHPDDYKSSYYSTLSKEEIITDRINKYNLPACIGLSLGHIANKPTLPLGVECKLDADTGRLTILESAVTY